MLPSSLRGAIRHELDGVSTRDLRAAAFALSERYREAATAGAGAAPLSTDTDRLAYLATRVPATYAAARAVLAELRARCPDFEPRTLVDLGAGPGTAAWAASAVFSSLEAATLVERDARLVAIGRRLLVGLPMASRWQAADLRGHALLGDADLVVLSYVVGELGPGQMDRVLKAAWAATRGALVIVEPGTPAGHRRVLAARALLAGIGAHLVAPCPHDRACPLGPGDWCHFAVRLARSREHRLVKGADLAFEDEKYSYVAATHATGQPVPARVIRRPELRKGHVRLSLCGASGLEQVTIVRSDRDGYRAARHARWGHGWVVDGR